MTPPDTELAVIEDALRDGRATATDPADRELQELALALSADCAEPRPEFAAELDERVRGGFPRARRLPRLPRPRRLLPVIAVASALLIALAVAVPLLSGGNDTAMTTDSAPPGGVAAAPRNKSAAPSADSGEELAGPAQQPGFDPGAPRRDIERSASLSLEAPGDKLDTLAQDVARVADRQRGFVLRSSVSSGDQSGGGSLDLRVPAERLRDTLRDLSGLAKVRSRSESGQDVTSTVVSASDRLESARAERASLLRRLRKAGDDTQAETLRQRLDANAIEVRRLRADLKALRLRTNYAAISVTLSDESRGDSLGGPTDSTTDALDDAAASLQASLNFLVRAAGVLLPVGLVLAALWLGTRAFVRRRRESALT